MNIRELQFGDYLAVHGLIVNEMEHAEVSLNDMSASLDAMKADSSYMLYVAEYDNQVVGFVSAVKLFGCIDSNYIEITCLVVSQSYQKKGIRKMLLKHIEYIGSKEGIEKFSVTSGKFRENAHAFYKRNGYELGGYAFYNGQVIIKKDS